MRLCWEIPHPTVASDLLSGLVFYGALHQEMASRATVNIVPSSSDDLSPPGRAELYPPAWVRQPTSDRPYRRCRRKDISVLTCVDREDRVAEAVHPRVRPNPQVRPIREVTPPHQSLDGYGRPAHAGTCPTAPSRSTHTLRQGPELDGIVRNGLLPLAEVGQHARCLAPDQRAIEHPPHLLREWVERGTTGMAILPHRRSPQCCLPDSNVSTSATLETSVANVSGWSEKNREHFVRNALQRLGSPAYISGAGSLGSCWGLWFPGMEKLGGVGGAAGDLNNCTWVVSSDTCATNACTARPVFNIFSSWRSIRALLPANSSCKPRVSAESMKIGQILLSQWRREDSVAEKESLLQEVIHSEKLNGAFRRQGRSFRRQTRSFP